MEFFHGYTYSAHPLACAAGLAALDLYRDEDLFARAKKLEPIWYDAAMTLKGLPSVLDIRCVGLTAGIDLASRPDAVGKRGYEAMERGFHDEGIMFRTVGDSIAVTPPLIVSESPDRRDLRQGGEGHQGAELSAEPRRGLSGRYSIGAPRSSLARVPGVMDIGRGSANHAAGSGASRHAAHRRDIHRHLHGADRRRRAARCCISHSG